MAILASMILSGWRLPGLGGKLNESPTLVLGGVNRDGHLVVDPNQAILILSLFPSVLELQIFLILRTQPLIERTCSIRTDTEIPWDEWGRGAVVMKIPVRIGTLAIIHGTRVLVIYDTFRDPGSHYRVHVFDVSRRGSATLPLLDGNEGGTERRAIFEDGRSCEFEAGDGMSLWDLQPLGDTIPLSVVSLLSYSIGRGIAD